MPSAGRTGRSSPEASSIPTLRKPLPSRCQGWPRQSACRADPFARKPRQRPAWDRRIEEIVRCGRCAGSSLGSFANSEAAARDMPDAIRASSTVTVLMNSARSGTDRSQARTLGWPRAPASRSTLASSR